MADNVNVDLLGEKELLRQLDRMDRKMGRKVLRKTTRAGSTPLRKAMRRMAPVGPDRMVKGELQEGGNLKRSIRTRYKFYSNSGVEVAITGPSYLHKGPHGHLVEFGTKPRYTTGKGSVPPGVFRGIMPRNEFGKRAWDSTKAAMEKSSVAKLELEVERVARGR